MDGLHGIVQAAIGVIRELPEDVLLERITVQGYDVTKLEAVYHVVEHFVGHTFQIIFATKLLTARIWGFTPTCPRPKVCLAGSFTSAFAALGPHDGGLAAPAPSRYSRP